MSSDSGDDLRVFWAAERTLLAWIRTGLAMMGFGFVVARFGLFLRQLEALRAAPPDHPHGLSLWIGTALVLLGVGVNLLAAWQHRAMVRRLFPGESGAVGRSALALSVAVLLAAIGLAMTAYLVTVQ